MSTVGDTARTVLTPVHRHFRLNRWSLFALAIAAMVAIPIIVVLSFVFAPASDVWHHLASTVLTRYTANTLWLVVGVSFATLVTGVGAAWLVTMCRFPVRRIFEWAPLLPIAVILAYGNRIGGSGLTTIGSRVASIGYAVPGSVIAVGVLLPFAWIDNSVDSWMRETFGISTGLLLSGTIVALLFAYLVRFLAISFNTVEASLAKVTPNMDSAARTLGARPWKTLLNVHAPMMWGSLLTAGLLVFVDVMKELPATLIMRPFDFNTLAVRTFELASGEQLAEAAGPALAIVMVGIIPVVLLSAAIARARPGQPPR